MTGTQSTQNGAGTRDPAPKWLKPTVDFGPLVVFFGAYYIAGLMAATGALMAATVIALGLSLAIERRVPVMPLVTAAIVGVFGGLTLWLNDDTFIKIKPTIVMSLLAAVLLGGLAIGRPLLKPLLGAAWPMNDKGWRSLTFRFSLFYVALAVLNEIVWRTQSEEFWVTFKVFGITGLTLIFAIAQAPLMTRNKISDAPETETPGT